MIIISSILIVLGVGLVGMSGLIMSADLLNRLFF